MNLNIMCLSCSSSFSVTPIIGILLLNIIRCHFFKSCFILDKAHIFLLILGRVEPRPMDS